ncbi:MAG TPA: hypothetical protein VE131_07190, partial [Terriglobales bacterium]|nr:hypothetical protein [Terriglobales bacterium]
MARQLAAIVLAGSLCLATIPSVFAQGFLGPPTRTPPTRGPNPSGFSTLLCLADALLGGATLSNNGD